MGSLFGNTQQNNQAGGGGGGGLFGSSTTQSNTGGGGLFGSNTNTNTNNTGGGGLLGSSTTQPSTGGGGLFGSSTAQQPSTGGGLFGSNTTQQNTGGGGLFGSSATQANTGGGGLFGANNAQKQQSTGGGLFGSSTTQQNNTGGVGLFGSSTTQQSNTGGTGLFGSTNNATTGGSGSSLFGQQNGTTTANRGAMGGASTSLFGTNVQQQQPSLFGGSASQAQQPQQQAQSSSMFQPATVSVGNLGHTMTQAQLQRLQLTGAYAQPNEKTVADQVITLANKWNPESDTTVLKTYLYNAVPKEYAPFFYPNAAAGEDERSWEEALSQKPDPPKIDGKEVDSLAYVPILVKGFKALGERAQTQATIVQQMRARLHEMNNSLTAIMDAHEQRITANISKAKRQHQVLQQKCLRLAVKVQVLRNRGYALDAAEEGLRKTLMSLEKQVMDPGFLGREDEIWARMIALKEKARWLEEEGKWVNAQVQQQQKQDGTSSGVPEHVMAKTKKILKDYDGQLQHLNKELEDVKKEFAEWEQSRK